MLAARATARRTARLSRSFATAVESAGVKVAAVDHSQPTSSVTFVVKAGSRFESKPGVANFLKNFAYKVGLLIVLQSRGAYGHICRQHQVDLRWGQSGRRSYTGVYCRRACLANTLRSPQNS